MEREERKWSIVMTGFHKTSVNFLVAIENAFGDCGVDTFPLVTAADRNLPLELAATLTEQQASEAAAKLAEGGFVLSVVPTAEVTDVKHRASDLWPKRSAHGVHFREIDGLITTCSRINSLEWIGKHRSQNPPAAGWQIEQFLNHHHFDWDCDVSPEGIEEVVNWIDQLSAALTECYPTVPFTISVTFGDIVSFWQTAADSPRDEYPWIAPPKDNGLTWCVKCQQEVRFESSDFCDKRFQNAEWGTCPTCDSLLLVRSFEQLLFVNDPRLPR